MKPSGYILHQTKTRVVIITGVHSDSDNEKTGAMAQVWILPVRFNPVEAVKTGHDAVVCGTCPLRGGNGCYVTVFQAPLAVWNAWQRGAYPELRDFSVLAGRKIRFGAWGDPYFMPKDLIARLARAGAGFTGYTHQWKEQDAAGLERWLMASVNSAEEQIAATLAGWRTFRVKGQGQARFSDEIVCPASNEAGKKVTCEQCGLCCGTSKGRLKNIVIDAHGSRVGRIEF